MFLEISILLGECQDGALKSTITTFYATLLTWQHTINLLSHSTTYNQLLQSHFNWGN